MLKAVPTHHLRSVSQLLLLHLQRHCVGHIGSRHSAETIDVVEGILTVTVLTQDAAIEIELVN